MKKLRYRYSLRIEFDSPITNHNFKVRCTPVTDERQKILQQNIHILPKEFLCENRDSFGNIYYFGRAEHPHNLFEIVTDRSGARNSIQRILSARIVYQTDQLYGTGWGSD